MQTNEMELEARALMDRARAETGVDDWGGLEFVEGLELLLRACQSQAGLGARGRQHLARACVHHLNNRLRVQALVDRHPEILDERIERPLFLVTFPRSGSSLLHRLLCQAPQIRAPLYGEMWQPAPAVGIDPSPAERHERISQADRLFLLPLEAMFPDDAAARGTMPKANEAGECYVLFENSFTSFNYTFDYYIPEYLDWLCGIDFEDVYRYFARQLAVLQWQAPGQPWVMKCADHLLGIEGLLSVFPDANIVVIHRDPKQMVASLGNLQVCHMDLWRERPMVAQVLGAYCLERYQRVADQAVSLRERVPPAQLCEFEYVDLVADPVAQATRVLEHFGYPIHPETTARFQAWLTTHPKPDNRYSLGAYGLEGARVEHALPSYARHIQERRG